MKLFRDFILGNDTRKKDGHVISIKLNTPSQYIHFPDTIIVQQYPLYH